MFLRGIDFGHVIGASGVQGFFGEGYWYHRTSRLFFPSRFSFNGMTFTGKTVTAWPREGNMRLAEDCITPAERVPDCIIIKPIQGVVLNAVGLSNPGAEVIFQHLQSARQGKGPFFISFAAVENTVEKRLEEVAHFARVLGGTTFGLGANSIGIQVNLSCPNTGHASPAWDELVREVHAIIEALRRFAVPLVFKINALMPIPIAKRITTHSYCDALCVSNTIPWGELPERIDWEGIFGTKTSPLVKRGYSPGGLSGPPLMPIVRDWVQSARLNGIEKPLIVGGGIFSVEDITALHQAGASAVSLGTVAMLRPWRVQKLIRYANELFSHSS